MHKPLRTQDDDLGDVYSKDASIEFDPKNDTTRQEFKDEADINTILRRFGIPNAFTAKQPIWGDTNFDNNLKDAMDGVLAAQRVLAELPPELRTKYPDLGAVMRGLDTGDFIIDLERVNDPNKEIIRATDTTVPADSTVKP